ncbi:hypothetical protein [Candidatus Venteria ishoeyi]|uniref:Tetratricopeptide repeat protein n=1 Tax=Candidatus Venteria ishoeyi TaxID=1899563 RepID=A0A1H6F8B2_9GAMM|nr:hypothetical protein [Candidatus Venteria ishoeyi]SEH06358.1 Uncharacterised protein [Candidatus Venteria ishoeyi]
MSKFRTYYQKFSAKYQRSSIRLTLNSRRVEFGFFAFALCLQFLLPARLPVPPQSDNALPTPPDVSYLSMLGLGDNTFSARLLMLWLQAFDIRHQHNFQEFDYLYLRQWLSQILALDPHSQYPLLAATRIYAEVADPERRRMMLGFVYQAFLAAPKKRWRWLADAVVQAKHRLQDKVLTLKYAKALAVHRDEGLPYEVTHLYALALIELGQEQEARQYMHDLLKRYPQMENQERLYIESFLNGKK